MIRYTVIWLQSAQGDLAELWMSTPDRQTVTAATRVIDIELSQDATTKGEELSEGLRVLSTPPLRTLFTINDGDRVVEVVRVKRR